jgi:hypothetical protein
VRPRGLALTVEAEYLGPAGRSTCQAEQQADRGGLARSVRPQITDRVAFGDLEVERGQGVHGAVTLRQPLHADRMISHERSPAGRHIAT